VIFPLNLNLVANLRSVSLVYGKHSLTDLSNKEAEPLLILRSTFKWKFPVFYLNPVENKQLLNADGKTGRKTRNVKHRMSEHRKWNRQIFGLVV